MLDECNGINLKKKKGWSRLYQWDCLKGQWSDGVFVQSALSAFMIYTLEFEFPQDVGRELLKFYGKCTVMPCNTSYWIWIWIGVCLDQISPMLNRYTSLNWYFVFNITWKNQEFWKCVGNCGIRRLIYISESDKFIYKYFIRKFDHFH